MVPSFHYATDENKIFKMSSNSAVKYVSKEASHSMYVKTIIQGDIARKPIDQLR